MRNVLFFGDSNTYGFDPESRAAGTGERFPAAVRWCGVTAHELGSSWHVIEEGLNGRTTVHEDPYRLTTHLSGGALLPTLLKSHLPLDVVVIMLGTNDLKPVYSLGLADIARGMAVLAEAVREKPAARSGTEAETPELFVENGRWGYRTAERVVVAPLYDNGFDFTEGLAAVQLGGTWHYIDTAGRTRLSCPGCAAVKPFRGGKAQVVRNGERQEIAHPLKTPRYQ